MDSKTKKQMNSRPANVVVMGEFLFQLEHADSYPQGHWLFTIRIVAGIMGPSLLCEKQARSLVSAPHVPGYAKVGTGPSAQRLSPSGICIL